jgi:hypothetical protein
MERPQPYDVLRGVANFKKEESNIKLLFFFLISINVVEAKQNKGSRAA